MTEKNVSFKVQLRVLPEDIELLRKSARELDEDDVVGEEDCTVEQALWSLCITPATPPVEVGYQILTGTEVTRLAEPNMYQLVVNVGVFKEAGVFAEAERIYFECWGDDEWVADTLEEALYELLLASNPNPSPCDLGFEIVDWQPVGH